MSLKIRFWTLLDIALRMPPVFIMDAVLNYAGDYAKDEMADLEWKKGNANCSTYEYDQVMPFSAYFDVRDAMVKLFLYTQVLFLAAFVLLFNTKQLILIYIRVASIFMILYSYELNTKYVNLHIDRMKNQETLWLTENTQSHIILLILAVLFSFINAVNAYPHIAVWIVFFAPRLACTATIPLSIIKATPTLAAIGSAILLGYSVWLHGLRVCETIYKGITWCHTIVENYGLYTMIENHWVKLHIPQILQVFWMLRTVDFIQTMLEESCSDKFLTEVFKGIIVNGSENIIALFGMTSIIAVCSQLIALSVQAFLQIANYTKVDVGNASAILFLVLSLQAGVTSAKEKERFDLVNKNLCLVKVALLHYVYNLVDSLLISLSASKNPKTEKHARALTAAAFLIAIPMTFLIYQWKTNSSEYWLVATTPFMIELIVKTLISLSIYSLFILDSYKNCLWENLDDYVYHLNAMGSTTEFIIGIYLLLDAVIGFFYVLPSVVRVIMLCCHAYFNVWKLGKKVWRSYTLRYRAMEKIKFLRPATKQELKLRKDVCAICFQELKSAKVTTCNHFFHAICLRKWLSVQDTCPLCHTELKSRH